jgi:CYTH domain-containing protein
MSNKTAENSLKYALIERERNFLLAPDQDLIKSLPFKTIIDNYIERTHIRFRKVTGNEGSIYKLTKKSPGGSPDKSVITTIYLTEHEYDTLNKFESILVQKTRFKKVVTGINIGIDKYVNGNDELWLAEIGEFETDEQMHNYKMPIKYIKEVTDDPDFNGYNLAKRFGRKNL